MRPKCVLNASYHQQWGWLSEGKKTVKTNLLCTGGGLVIAVSVVALAQVPESMATRVVGTREGRDLSVLTPPNASVGVETLVMRVTSAAGVPAGVEVVIDEPLPDRVVQVVRNRKSQVVTGRPLGEVLNLLVATAPSLVSSRALTDYRFAWHEDGGVVHVSPLGGRQTFLDTVVPSFQTEGATLVETFDLIGRILEPDRNRGRPERIVTADGREQEVFSREPFTRRVSLTRRNVPLRDLLDAVILAYGGFSWSVRYRSIDGEYSRSIMILHSFSGPGIARTAGK
jgi:hypothetical protein